MDFESGRLILPGGKREKKLFMKEMKKLRSKWVSEMSRRYARGGSIYKTADLCDALIDSHMGNGTDATMDLIFELDRGRDEAIGLVEDAADIMSKYGGTLYDPISGGSRDPGNFSAESQENRKERKQIWDEWWERNKHKKQPDWDDPQPF